MTALKGNGAESGSLPAIVSIVESWTDQQLTLSLLLVVYIGRADSKRSALVLTVSSNLLLLQQKAWIGLTQHTFNYQKLLKARQISVSQRTI